MTVHVAVIILLGAAIGAEDSSVNTIANVHFDARMLQLSIDGSTYSLGVDQSDL
jgi:hypothetical protein